MPHARITFWEDEAFSKETQSIIDCTNMLNVMGVGEDNPTGWGLIKLARERIEYRRP